MFGKCLMNDQTCCRIDALFLFKTVYKKNLKRIFLTSFLFGVKDDSGVEVREERTSEIFFRAR